MAQRGNKEIRGKSKADSDRSNQAANSDRNPSGRGGTAMGRTTSLPFGGPDASPSKDAASSDYKEMKGGRRTGTKGGAKTGGNAGGGHGSTGGKGKKKASKAGAKGSSKGGAKKGGSRGASGGRGGATRTVGSAKSGNKGPR